MAKIGVAEAHNVNHAKECAGAARAASMKVGRLVIGSRPWHHGVLGTASILAASLAVAFPETKGLFAFVIASTTPLAVGSLNLLGQAPQFTVIARGIVAPHRLAYKRTITVVLYLNLRLLWAAGWWPLGDRAYACAVDTSGM